MSMWQFQNPEKVEKVLLDSLGTDYIIPGGSNDQTVFFHNGDKMTVDMKTGLMEWEPITPGSFTTSKLAMRLHQWFAKGIIIPKVEGEA